MKPAHWASTIWNGLRLAPPAAIDLDEVASPVEDFQLVRCLTPGAGKPYVLSVDHRDPDSFHQAVAGRHFESSPVWRFLTGWVRPGDVVFDLGANIGSVCIPLAAMDADVHAFEILPENLRHLLRAAGETKISALRITAAAVADRIGFLGVEGLSAYGMTKPGTALYNVPSITLDDYAAHHKLGRVDIMKIDIEGSEKAALAGAERLISRHFPDIVIESNSLTCGGSGYSYRTLLGALTAQGYSLYRIENELLAPAQADHVQEIIVADYLATIKTEAEIATRIGWRCAVMTRDEIVTNLIGHAVHSDVHKQHVLAVWDKLPAAVRAHAGAAAAVNAWQPLLLTETMATVRTGTA